MSVSLASELIGLFYNFWFSSSGNENLFGNYKPFSSDPSCTSNLGQAIVRGCDENRTGYVD